MIELAISDVVKLAAIDRSRGRKHKSEEWNSRVLPDVTDLLIYCQALRLPQLSSMEVDSRVLAFAFCISVLSCLFFGLGLGHITTYL